MFNKQMVIGLAVGMMMVSWVEVRGDHRHRCDCIASLASELQQHGRALAVEFRSGYCSTRQHGILQRGARELVLHAGRLQSLARSGASVDALQCELRTISGVYRGLVETVRSADLTSNGPGYPGQAWLYGHVEPRNPQVQRLLGCIEQTICKIQENLPVEQVVVRRPTSGRHDHDIHRGNGGREYGREYGIGHSGWGIGGTPQGPSTAQRSGFSISNGRLTFQFGR